MSQAAPVVERAPEWPVPVGPERASQVPASLALVSPVPVSVRQTNPLTVELASWAPEVQVALVALELSLPRKHRTSQRQPPLRWDPQTSEHHQAETQNQEAVRQADLRQSLRGRLAT